jgi:hypothetical protein
VRVYGVQHHFQQYLRYIVAVSFIGGRNLSTQRKPPTCPYLIFWNFSDPIVEVNAMVRHFRQPWALIRKILQ